MTALLLTIALAGSFWLIGIAVLALCDAATESPRVALCAPAVGAATTALATFLLSYAGVSVGVFAAPLAAGLLIIAVAIIALRRPSLPRVTLVIAAISLVGLVLTAWPMTTLGFHWIANANDDMANYTLSAQWLLHHGLGAPLDAAGLLRGRDYATALTVLQQQGSRPGSDLVLALVSALTGRVPYEVFMPTILAFSMAGIAAVGALAWSERRAWTAPLGAALIVLSPMATYAVLQQLFAQALGVTLATALLTLALRRELYRGHVDIRRELVPVGVLFAGLLLGYIELASTLAFAYFVYLAALALRRELSIRRLLWLWIGVAVVALILLNGYLPTELSYLQAQITHGSSLSGHPPTFGYMLMPSALPTLLGFQELATQTSAPLLGFSIALSLVLLIGALALACREAYRGSTVAALLVGDAILAVYLVINDADFGLLKLAMYVQPFLAAALALLVGRLRVRWLPFAAAALVLLAIADLSTQQIYVSGSRNPGDFRDGSAADLLPRAAAVVKQPGPTVVVGDNPIFIKLTAENGYGHTVFFLSRDDFSGFVGSEQRLMQAARVPQAFKPTTALFATHASAPRSAAFIFDPAGEAALDSPSCKLVVPTGRQVPFNRLSLPGTDGDLASGPCTAARDLLAPVDSTLGQSFYLPAKETEVSLYQLQPDPFFPGQTMAAMGRYQLFEVVGPTTGMRLMLNDSFSFVHDGVNRIPASTITGSSRLTLPVTGVGSARVISAPVHPEMIDGKPYLLLDIGEQPRIHYDRRRGLDALFGTSIPLDGRRLTGYIRNISLISASAYAHLRPPLAVTSFPAGLGNPSLQYSGVYEDGWVGQSSYFVLAGGPAATFVLRAEVPPGAAHHLIVTLNGKRIADMTVTPGNVSLHIPAAAASGTRRISLEFAGRLSLPAPDYRPVSALLQYVGFSAGR